MRRLASTATFRWPPAAQPSMTAASSSRPSSSSSSSMPRARTWSTNDASEVRIVASSRQRAACSALAPPSATSSWATVVRGQLVELVDGADRGCHVGQAEATVEALDQLSVVELEAHRRQRQRVQRLDHHPHHLDVVVEGQLVPADDVDVGLQELAVSALLRALTTPRGLDLVAPERKLEVSRVLEDVAGERHGQVVVQPPAGVGRRRRRPAAGARRRSPCRSRRPWRVVPGARRRGSRCSRSRAARRCARARR